MSGKRQKGGVSVFRNFRIFHQSDFEPYNTGCSHYTTTIYLLLRVVAKGTCKGQHYSILLGKVCRSRLTFSGEQNLN